ncbi:hypothetical protein C8J55DRAFT_21492 [Lentinula edodes]|uniref:Uncharacterized protein n=1 Tax=Lentinula lateritia TaxID=40482 RepID=A0A9W9AMP1_9AGAR|nr:hypothetical protein C8J55DRAFT_21492 [Lentinula edodes]
MTKRSCTFFLTIGAYAPYTLLQFVNVPLTFRECTMLFMNSLLLILLFRKHALSLTALVMSASHYFWALVHISTSFSGIQHHPLSANFRWSLHVVPCYSGSHGPPLLPNIACNF